MAIYHFHARTVSRAKGKSSVEVASKRSAERIRDEHLGITFNHTRIPGVEYTEILAPANAPVWVYDRERLWNEVEKSEKRINSRTAREIELALPKELSNQAQEELLKNYAKECFVCLGMIADITINRKNKKNPYANIMLTTRRIDVDGFGIKDRSWNARKLVLHWREQWAEKANSFMKREGINQKIDHRSYAEQGIDLEPTKHLGFRADQVENDKRDLTQEKWKEHKIILRNNSRNNP